MLNYKTALSIAGSDPCGGAGIQADLKTFSALGCYGMTVLTALTAQNTQGVQSVQGVTSEFVTAQLSSIFTDIKVNAAKTGMLYDAAIINSVAEAFTLQQCPLIIDPVMVAKDGSCLLKTDALIALKTKLLPKAYLITPNLPEAELLLQHPIKNFADMEQAAYDLTNFGSQAALIKGGHCNTINSNDCLYIRESQKLFWLESPRINTQHTHGTGCSLSAAITAFTAQGLMLFEAVSQAKTYLTNAIAVGSQYHLGQGHGPVHHFHSLWNIA